MRSPSLVQRNAYHRRELPTTTPTNYFHLQLIFILFIASLLMFLSSFISLQHHQANEMPSSKSFPYPSAVKRLFNLPLKANLEKPAVSANEIPNVPIAVGNDPHDIAIVGKEKSQNDTRTSVFSSTDAVLPSPNHPFNPPRQERPFSNSTPTDRQRRCLVRFPPKCPIHPLVHYWNEFTDCYISSLRSTHGLQAKSREDQRFIVFQPDLGGWNNIRMALEVVILFAKVTGRILVLPPDAVLYLLILNKKWGENKSNMDDYFDFSKLQANEGLETMPMKEFLEKIAKPGLLSLPLPDNNVDLIRKPLWDYLEKACFVRQWSPGKTYIGFNISSIEIDVSSSNSKKADRSVPYQIGTFESVDFLRTAEFSLKGKRTLIPYDAAFDNQRAIFFPGHEENRLLTHFYSYLFFDTAESDHKAKRYMRDRLRYHDEMFCVASKIIMKLLLLQEHFDDERIPLSEKLVQLNQQLDLSDSNTLDQYYQPRALISPTYAAFHIRRGDFQQKHTRLPAEQIVALTNHLVPDRKNKIVYISTDEKNRSFFEPFVKEYRAIYFLDDISANTGIEKINQNYIGMIEQIVCVAADVFIGTPLSTFTAYITRMRGYLNRTIDIPYNSPSTSRKGIRMNREGIYSKTYYFMRHHMYQLQQKPKVHLPLWIRDFVDVFQDIDD